MSVDTSSHQTTDSNPLVLSHLTLRRCIGLLGLVLPFALMLGLPMVCEGDGCGQIQGSISRYYHSAMGDVLVGALCAIGVFLLAYKGYSNRENVTASISGTAAIGIALFPMALDGATDKEVVAGYAHTAFSAVFFFGLAYLAIHFFPRPDPSSPPVPGKEKRKRIYRACGVTILVAIALMGIYSALDQEIQTQINRFTPIYWLESLAIVAFGVAWLTKGRALKAVVDFVAARTGSRRSR